MPEKLRSKALIDAARRQTGLQDFGGDSWREGLELLIDSANGEAQLNEIGVASVESHVVTLLANRLQVTDWLSRHREILRQRIERPVFIVGLGRTGSTRLQYLLAQDPAHRSLRRWESTRSCPPPRTGETDRDPRIALTEQEDEALGLLIPDFKSIHYEPADGPTECVMLFRQEFKSFCFESQWVLPAWGRWFMTCDMAPVYAYHQRVLKLLQWRDPGRWILKSPVHSLALEDLLARYPDARFVMTHRDPLRVLASTISLAAVLTGVGSDADHRAYLVRRWAEVSEAVVRRIMEFRRAHPEVAFHDLHYRELVEDPMRAVRGTYAFLGEDLGPETEARIREYARAHPQGEFGVHHYTLEEFGVDPARERERFAEYIDTYGVGEGRER